ncbi:uncharacterized protein G2W53_042067 [Senna tora]|uniref:Uncharacterized protein n=1 Tax=Senna tora TaxID=362788 RepID=A0A834W214_9FABA|nr:uncharacterized protein G2W53_042067 [Senna tora]
MAEHSRDDGEVMTEHNRGH